MSDNTGVVWGKFFNHRTRVLWDRFPGVYRAVVVETNDPLSMYRVRFKCPDMHDFNMLPEDCPWAVAAPEFGGSRAGRFVHPCIGDWIWITFERQHPYAPVWVGFASPTRRKLYTYPQVFNKTPVSLNIDGTVNPTRIEDYDIHYLPADGRPMMHGWQDRYGNADMHSSVGYYPTEHKILPPPSDYDNVQSATFQSFRRLPLINAPDKKYMIRVTKYGNMMLMGDQGYFWHKEGNTGEFYGDTIKDEQFEVDRWKYIQKLANENRPASYDSQGKKAIAFGDQRRILTMTRYGHRIECRDVGWAQEGPIKSTSRKGEYGDPSILSKEKTHDFRWIKLRTKAGMLFQAYDKGSDPSSDDYITRPLLEEQGHLSEREDAYWGKKDARWMRLVTRYGLKIVLDDRGTDPKSAEKNEYPRANGVLIKGRRSPASKKRIVKDNPRGFYWEFNENDAANHTMWGTPLGNTIEMNDRYQYLMLAAAMGSKWAAVPQGIKENEFIGKPLMIANPERTSHHLKLDHDNEYIRLKTRSGRGHSPDKGVNPTDLTISNEMQGIEIHDGSKGDGPWVEMVDCEGRGLWLSKKNELSILRGKRRSRMFMWMDEKAKEIVIFGGAGAKIKIHSSSDIELHANKDIKMQAGGTISLHSGGPLLTSGAGSLLTIGGGGVSTNGNINAAVVHAFFPGTKAGGGAGTASPGGSATYTVSVPPVPSTLEPTDRAKTYNAPFEVCPRDEIQHPIK